MTTQACKSWSVVTVSTIAFTVCFMLWMMLVVIGTPIKKALDLNETPFGILAALPLLTGSLIRLPLGMRTGKFGGRSLRSKAAGILNRRISPEIRK